MSSFDAQMNYVLDVSPRSAVLRPIENQLPRPISPSPTWECRYQELLNWLAKKGDTCVPKAEGALGRWVARQRELKRTGKLDPSREQALNSIGFIWNTVTAMWEERFRRLSEWKRTHGHCAVPIAQGELGTWVSKQRQLRKRGKLAKEKIELLDSLKFTWSTAEADWEDKFKRLCEWTKRHGHASVPFNEGELGWWVNTQRQCKRKGKLSVGREARLQTLGFVWNPSSSRSRNSNTNASTSSAESIPVSIPGMLESIVSEVDTNEILQLFEKENEDPQLLQQNPSPVSEMEEQISCTELTSPDHPKEEISSAPLLSQNLWSPSLFSSSLLNVAAIPTLPLPHPFGLHMPVPTSQPLALVQSVQCHSEALEQLLARDDSCSLEQLPIDSLTCDEDL